MRDQMIRNTCFGMVPVNPVLKVASRGDPHRSTAYDQPQFIT